jgi:hypothetical protein
MKLKIDKKDKNKERIDFLNGRFNDSGTEGMFFPQTDINHYRYYYRY